MAARTKILVLTLALTALALFVRVHRLGDIGFYGDEETTALPARSLAEGGPPAMPSGMEYRRALPMTFFNSVAARVFGLDEELPYRLPAALFGALAVPLLFLLGRRHLGPTVAFAAALALALSEWHLSHSREARMYSSVLLFYLLTGFAAWRWARTGRPLDLGWFVLAFLAATSIHHSAIFAISFAVLPLAFRGASKAPVWLHLVVCGVLGAIGMAYEGWVKRPYQAFSLPETGGDPMRIRPAYAFLDSPVELALVGLGVLVGLVAAWRGEPRDDDAPGTKLRLLARLGVAAAAGGLAWGGQAFGAGVCVLVYLYLHDGERSALLRRTWPLVAATVIALGARVGVEVLRQGVGPGIKSAFELPYPTAIWMGEMFPGMHALFFGAAIWIALRKPKPEQDFLRLSALAYFLPVFAIGIATRYAPMRYVFVVYPFLLCLAAFALVGLIRRFVRHRVAAGAIAAVVIVSGVLGGHGVGPAWKLMHLDYGTPLNEATFSFPFYPDHKGPGRYVREHLREGDEVVAVDMLQQYWYVGRCDYWLRSVATHSNFIFEAEDGAMRDAYVASRALPDDLLAALAPAPGRRLWIITSGELSYRAGKDDARHWHALSDAQQAWLTAIEERLEPVYVGRDGGATKVYLLKAAP